MYKIKAEGKEYYSDTLVYVKKATNGCYVPCLAEEAELSEKYPKIPFLKTQR